MIYQLRANLFFTDKLQADGVFTFLNANFKQATLIHPDFNDMEFSFIELIENHHDETPTKPCTLLKSRHNAPIDTPREVLASELISIEPQ